MKQMPRTAKSDRKPKLPPEFYAAIGQVLAHRPAEFKARQERKKQKRPSRGKVESGI